MQAQASPPPVIISKEDAASAFPGFPRTGEGKSKNVILAVTFHGEKPALQIAKAQLERDSWKVEYVARRSGELVLAASAKGRSVDDIRVLNDRCAKGEFGDAKCEPFVLADPMDFY